MFDTGGSDERPGRQPPPADDRLWRHPSEVARSAAPAAVEPRSSLRQSGRRFSLSTVVVAGSLGALAMLAALSTFGVIATVMPRTDEGDGNADGAARLAGTTTAPPVVAAGATGVVAVRVGGADGVVGAGLVLDASGLVVTALSTAASPATSVSVEGPPGSWASADVVGSDAATGLVLLRAEKRIGEPARTAAAPKVGDDVTLVEVGSGPTPPYDARSTRVLRTNGALAVDGTEHVGLATLWSRRPAGPAHVAVDHSGGVVALIAAHDDDPGDELSFAVPAELAVRVGEQLVDRGTVDQGHIDATIAVTATGVSVVDVAPGSHAAAAGLRAGDEVTTVGSTPVATAAQLAGALAGRSSGERVQLGVRRDHAMLTVTVQLAPPAPASTTTLVSTAAFP